jgi:hypothetical protein
MADLRDPAVLVVVYEITLRCFLRMSPLDPRPSRLYAMRISQIRIASPPAAEEVTTAHAAGLGRLLPLGSS